MNILAVKELDIEDLVHCEGTCSSCSYELRAYCGFIPCEIEESLDE